MSIPKSNFFDEKIECLFGFCGVILTSFLVVLAVLNTPDFDILTTKVSDLGNGPAKAFFSTGFVVGGCLAIPFFIYFEKNVLRKITIDKSLKVFGKIEVVKLTRGGAIFLSILSSLCIALVGIIPDETHPTLFRVFHGIYAGVSFFGTALYILLFSILLRRAQNFNFPKFLAYLGYAAFGAVPLMLILALFEFFALGEWIAAILLLLWLFLTSALLLFSKNIREDIKKIQQAVTK